MGTGWREFMFDESGEFHRISQRMMNGLADGCVTLPEFAGQTCRFAHVFLGMENRKPTHITHIEYCRYKFDEKGCIRTSLKMNAGAVSARPTERQRQLRGSLSKMPSISVVRAEREFQQLRWEPTPAEVTRIVNAIWKK